MSGAIQKICHTFFGPNLTPSPSVTNCQSHMANPPIKNMSQATTPPDSMHLVTFAPEFP